MAKLMTGFPPAPEDQVSLANWREAPFNRWSFRHVREIIPTADIACDPDQARPVPVELVATDKIRIRGTKDRVLSLDDFLMTASTDALVILHRGRSIVERYADGMTAETPHILMSVSKSVLGLLTGILVSEGILDPDRQVTRGHTDAAGAPRRAQSVARDVRAVLRTHRLPDVSAHQVGKSLTCRPLDHPAE